MRRKKIVKGWIKSYLAEWSGIEAISTISQEQGLGYFDYARQSDFWVKQVISELIGAEAFHSLMTWALEEDDEGVRLYRRTSFKKLWKKSIKPTLPSKQAFNKGYICK